MKRNRQYSCKVLCLEFEAMRHPIISDWHWLSWPQLGVKSDGSYNMLCLLVGKWQRKRTRLLSFEFEFIYFLLRFWNNNNINFHQWVVFFFSFPGLDSESLREAKILRLDPTKLDFLSLDLGPKSDYSNYNRLVSFFPLFPPFRNPQTTQLLLDTFLPGNKDLI